MVVLVVSIADHFVDEDAEEVDDCGHDACVLAAREEGLQEDDLAEDSLTVEPEEDPQVESGGVSDHVVFESGPGKGRHDCVDAGVEEEPRQPVWSVCHAHDAHGLFRS